MGGEGWRCSTSSVELRLGPGRASVQMCAWAPVYVCVHTHARVHTCIDTVHTHKHMYTHACACPHMHVRVCMCVSGPQEHRAVGEESVITGITVLLVDA